MLAFAAYRLFIRFFGLRLRVDGSPAGGGSVCSNAFAVWLRFSLSRYSPSVLQDVLCCWRVTLGGTHGRPARLPARRLTSGSLHIEDALYHRFSRHSCTWEQSA